MVTLVPSHLRFRDIYRALSALFPIAIHQKSIDEASQNRGAASSWLGGEVAYFAFLVAVREKPPSFLLCSQDSTVITFLNAF